ncbi:hypothetical protein ACFQZE_06960 [Paenibacillus sp. GCM10027627]|uniref:hypothetical protein n=1 Tax=unclassified Paenibacillus TaxID=185978 RepID=UPI003629260B
MIKQTFDNVVSYETEGGGQTYIIHLGIKDFSEQFNIPVKYFDPVPQTSAFEPMDLGIYVNLKGTVTFESGILSVEGEVVVFDGLAKLERRLHPETDVIVRIFANISNEQIIKLLNPIKN